MKCFKIAFSDIKNIFKNRIIRISVIAIIIVPLLYSMLYLKAFWDPYGNVKNMNIAVVNLDKGCTVDGKNENYGKDIVEDLRENTKVGWNFTSSDEADKGLLGKKYYAKFVIPSDFSEKVLSAKNGKPKVANLQFICNEEKNFLASQISGKVKTELKENITETISKNYVVATFDNLYDVKDGLVAASDGSNELYKGIGQLNEKIPMLKDGVNELQNGSKKLYDGQVSLNSGIKQIEGGLSEVNNKVPTLESGVNKLYEGSSEMEKGLENASEGSKKLSSGSQDLYTAFSNSIYPSVKMLKSGANQLNEAISSGSGLSDELLNASKALNSGSKKIASSSNEVLNGYEKVEGGVNELVNGVNASSDLIGSVAADLQKALESGDSKNIEIALSKIQEFNNANKDTKQKINALQKGSKELASKLNEFNSGVQGYTDKVVEYSNATASSAESLKPLSDGVAKISSGLNELEKGLNENNPSSFGSGLKLVSQNMSNLDSGISKLNTGAKAINSGLYSMQGSTPLLVKGISDLYNGSIQMESGSQQLIDGQGKLNNGVGEMSSKMPEMSDGVEKLYNGSDELSTKLKEGADDIKSGLVNSSDSMGDFVSSPINIDDSPINPVGSYGAGFAPYFMSLSLWVGAIMMFFVISTKRNNTIEANRFSKVVGNYLSFAFIGVLQAILVAYAIYSLGLNPVNLPLYFALVIFFSVVFVSIVYCLISLFGDVGRLLCVVLLILQLTGSGGTFPIEVVPNFFKAINPYLPFTYSVEALREAISASVIDYSIIWKDVIILGIVGLVFLIASILFRSTGERLQDTIEKMKHETREIEKSAK